MFKYLAAICFLAASVLICHGISRSDRQTTPEHEKAEARFDPETARSARTSHSARNARMIVITERQRKTALSALLSAADVKPSKGQSVQWSEANFKYHLTKLTKDDAQGLLIELLVQKVPAVLVTETDRANSLGGMVAWLTSNTNHSKLISGLVGMLAKQDFLGTVSWLESLPILKKNLMLSRVVFDYALRAGAAQAPSEAWRVYQKKCPPWFG